MDKLLIAERFAKARSTYAREARVQHQVAEKMMGMLTDATLPTHNGQTEQKTFSHIVELGCGTGSYSHMLLHTLQPDTLLLNDLCREMEECVAHLCTNLTACPTATNATSGSRVSFCHGDAEAIDFPNGTDLITSCSTLQWFNDPAAFFVRCHDALQEQGILAFSSFGASNMCQIKQLTGHGLHYLPIEEIQALLDPYFDILRAEEEIVSLPFATPQEVLKHLKQTGVTGTEKKIWTRGRLQDFCQAYTTLFGNADGNVTLTYHPVYIVARKKKKQGD